MSNMGVVIEVYAFFFLCYSVLKITELYDNPAIDDFEVFAFNVFCFVVVLYRMVGIIFLK
jgi:hypothetical protein